MEQHGDFHLFSVVRLPLPLEGSAKLAVKGTGGKLRLSYFNKLFKHFQNYSENQLVN